LAGSWKAVAVVNESGRISVLATAGSLLVTVMIWCGVGAVFSSVWAFSDLLARPALACRVAHVSKNKWLVVLGLAPVIMLIASLGFALHVVNGLGLSVLLLALGFTALLAGVIGGIWYLVAVRPWIASQLSFARRAGEPG
jgi:hypothetical protein